jgi:hypothetical protein
MKMKQRVIAGPFHTPGMLRRRQTSKQLLSRPIPDFSNELDQFEKIVASYESSATWDDRCDEWIDGVSQKLNAWNPNFARQFNRRDLLGTNGGGHMLLEYRKLVELEVRCSRLQRIAFPEKRNPSRLSRFLAK